MTIKSVISKGRAFNGAIAKTVVALASELAQDIWDTFGEDITDEDAQAIGDGISDVGARVSEWKKFALAVPFGMVEAIKAYPKGEMTRVKMFGLARAVHKAGDYTHVKATVAAFVSKVPASGGGAKASIGMGLGIIKNTDTAPKGVTKANMNAFRRDLKALCDQYGITY